MSKIFLQKISGIFLMLTKQVQLSKILHGIFYHWVR